jgi:protein-S-isoprenylcysteine O-methyltransferase Ste14
MSLEWKVALRMVFMPALLAAVIFLPAGTFRFWQGWTFLATMFLLVLVGFAYFLRYDRPLVERRMRTRERVKEQKLLMRVFMLLFLGAFMLPGFDYRLGWSRRLVGDVPAWVTAISLALVVSGLLFVFWVLQVNSYAGRTITVDAGQTVISSGPYAWVRHPLYLGSVILCLGAPLALGSWVALPVFALLIPFYALRLLNEEKVLCDELPGYPEYCLKTRYHLIPFVW